ncbi:unnamed protein product [Cochlearia groenlandica]
MKHDFYHEIDNDPEPEDAGTIRVTARIFGVNDNLTFTSLSLAKDFIEDHNVHECKTKDDLIDFMLEAKINDDDILHVSLDLIGYVDDVTCDASSEYSPTCALEVWLDLGDEDGDSDGDSHIEEPVQDTNIRFRQASKLVAKSLTRKIHNKKIQKKKRTTYKKVSLEECVICLEGFNNGGRVVTLPCGHYFDNECIMKWFQTSHVCPLCRFKLSCDDQCTIDLLQN